MKRSAIAGIGVSVVVVVLVVVLAVVLTQQKMQVPGVLWDGKWTVSTGNNVLGVVCMSNNIIYPQYSENETIYLEVDEPLVFSKTGLTTFNMTIDGELTAYATRNSDGSLTLRPARDEIDGIISGGDILTLVHTSDEC
jgi:hypothetical protein